MTRDTLKRQLVHTATGLVFGLLGFLACVQHFALTLPQKPPLADSFTDGLVVATGGQERHRGVASIYIDHLHFYPNMDVNQYSLAC